MLRKTREITIKEGLNHTELVAIVSKGVRAVLAEQEPPQEPP